MYFDCTPPVALGREIQNQAGSPPTLREGSDEPITSELVILGSSGGTMDSSRLDEQLEALIGPVRVVDPAGAPLDEYLNALLADDAPLPPRLVLKLRQSHDAGRCRGLSPALVAKLAAQGFQLIGSDLRRSEWGSAQAIGSHLAEQGIFFLEGLDLQNVPTGDYVLIALPVPAGDARRCPVRVVLKAVT
ncbi:hypothetical protein GC173_08035 [bacterium]|nr:hypothetical protein [bacterium]